ncbi:MAG: GMC oxidoreductase, partial [Pseudomonadota bacterium]
GVGKNLQDHLDCTILYEVSQPITFFRETKPWREAMSGLRYVLFGDGPATEYPTQTGAFLKSRPELEVPDLQIHFVPGLVYKHAQIPADRHGMTGHICQLRPESRGYITIRSDDPLDEPVIQPNYLEAESDRRALVEGVKIMRDIFAQQAFDSYRGPELAPGATVNTDEEIAGFVRENAETIYHPIGTCKMGTDEMAVVGADLKVHGTENLRVVDASVMPTLIGGNTNAPTIMIAEKAADMILGKPPLPAEIVPIAEDAEDGLAVA